MQENMFIGEIKLGSAVLRKKVLFHCVPSLPIVLTMNFSICADLFSGVPWLSFRDF